MKERKSQLVCEHLENISRTALEEYQTIIRKYVRNRHGIYALYLRGKLQYVGLAGSLQGRLKTHLHDRHKDSWDRFSVYLTITDSHLRELESLILRIVQPTGNMQKDKFAQSEDLRRRFHKDLMESQRAERDNMFGRKARQPKAPPAKSGREPAHYKYALCDYVSKRMVIKSVFKGQSYTAQVEKNGLIVLHGQSFATPSAAGSAVTKRGGCNGWRFWRFERAPGEWVFIDQLRK
jgi:hypothetical protein